MVFISDSGSAFDAPLEVVWKYLQSAADHGPSHKGRRNVQQKALGNDTIERTWEQDINGEWVRMGNRITTYAPVGYAVESIDGPWAGSKWITYYTPKGERTEVAVVGEWVSKSVPADQIRTAVMANLERFFEEDTAGLRAFTQKA
jgi:hypothetical protein